MSKGAEDLFRRMAPVITGSKGADSLNRFAKLIVIGELRSKGFLDGRNNDLKELFKRNFVFAGNFNLLIRFSFIKDNGYFYWDFASGSSVGRSTGENTYVSSKGRYSKWVGNGAERNWEEGNLGGVVLLGLDDDSDFHFHFLSKEAFLQLNKDRILIKPGSKPDWSENWKNLSFEQSFATVFGN